MQSRLGGRADAFALKLSGDLTQLLFGSYIGGPGDEAGRAASANSQGIFFIGGGSTSAGWPIHPETQQVFRGSGDAVVLGLNLGTPTSP